MIATETILRYENTLLFETPNLKDVERWSGVAQISPKIMLKYDATRYRAVADSPSVRRSNLSAVLLRDSQCIGNFKLARYNIQRAYDKDEFWRAMDCSSGAEEKFAYILCKSWADVVHQVAPMGPIIRIDHAWLDRAHAGKNLLASTIDVITERIWPNFSIIVLKAYPLEFASVRDNLDGNAHLQRAQLRRQRAMMRHYQGIVGAKPLPGPAGDDGWLWSANPNAKRVIPPPREQSRWIRPD